MREKRRGRGKRRERRKGRKKLCKESEGKGKATVKHPALVLSSLNRKERAVGELHLSKFK